jgi:hypothetical protein
MSTSRTTLRLITLLFLLAGLLLLRKPAFGQAVTTASTRFSIVITGSPKPSTLPAGRSIESATAPVHRMIGVMTNLAALRISPLP